MLNFEKPPQDKALLDESRVFTPRFDENGLVTAVVTDARDNAVLMLAHMNAEALALTLQTGFAHYYSRSRKAIWKKGETSGNLQRVETVLADCDQDAVLIKVTMTGHAAACHTGRRSCFYRSASIEGGKAVLTSIDDDRAFDPKEVYGGK
ncbi:phosphoribosyl-AMP cyclohydrolase [Martelella mediterranea]|uniref:Phosphoribosyl-AMP cyclohydrolase n=1 Tax=Martelella mediterranea DSM 17316 TaxID=1122214 RepID=A0A1U9Z6V4_9HYPH|nr:phosphoribosyl-AMP cyclohydrolase [Martelella mediterranea]AQZ53312.1 phosphoribosyl-AMP cyclohydrolase [Martelella mediterranea DSM 17316]